MDLVTIGDLMVDVRVDTGALARGGDVHGRVLVQPGGSAANAAAWGAWSGAGTGLYGRVGDDVAGRILRRALLERGVEPHLAVDPEADTGTMLVVHEAGERSMVADRGANERLSPSDLPDPIRATAVLVSGYLLLHEACRPGALAALERAEATYVGVDPASWPLVEDFGVERFLSETAPANVVLANELEARTLTGEEGAAAARALSKRYAVAVVKLGAEGAVACVGDQVLEAPAERVAEVDPTGAGDAFDGVFLASLARGAGPGEALRRACHAGALQVSSRRSWPVGTGS
ncbi:MAG TPA: carbohydrate kinase family protein [Actinomycetota bacterium]|nr:carbohydrate kinase family protein [Actinomycetota bacterium]